MSALFPDGSLNVEHLTEEIRSELLLESKYRAENEMKKRAVHTSKDYNEFQAFVSCSQLKPVQSKELKAALQPGATTGSAGGNKQREGLNTIDQLSNLRRIAGSAVKDKRNNQHVLEKFSAPAERVKVTNGSKQMTLSSFERSWRRECTTMKEKLHFLSQRITPPHFCSPSMYGKSALEPSVMCEILHVLSVGLKGQEMESKSIDNGGGKEITIQSTNETDTISPVLILDWMIALTKCDRFDLNVAFLSKVTKEETLFLIDYITKNAKCATPDNENVITLDKMESLRAKYKV